jgi:hypothetical protein
MEKQFLVMETGSYSDGNGVFCDGNGSYSDGKGVFCDGNEVNIKKCRRKAM